MTRTPAPLSTLQRSWAAVRSQAPLVHCLTNVVTVNHVANAVLAVGATPAMVDIREEAGQFAPVASALLINVGTPHDEQRDAMREAARAAQRAGTPWVLDPVAVGSLTVRTALALELLAYAPSVIRGNASEVIALAGLGSGGRGVDSAHEVDDARAAARDLARSTGAVVAVSGATDLIVSAAREDTVTGGDEMLTRMTGGGCALGGIIAAHLGAGADAHTAAVAACSGYGLAAERAVAASRGPGSFAAAVLDELHGLHPADVRDADREQVRA